MYDNDDVMIAIVSVADRKVLRLSAIFTSPTTVNRLIDASSQTVRILR